MSNMLWRNLQYDEYVVFDICNHSYHLKCLNQWKCQCNSASTVYKCELCQEFEI